MRISRKGVTAVLLLASLGMAPAQARHTTAVAVFAGGCYWGMESVFEHIQGVTDVVAGFAVPAGQEGYAEAASVTYDTSRISYQQLLQVFFAAHDPTEMNRQGPDEGPQYRSVVFVSSERQRQAARAFLDDLQARHVYARPVVTEVSDLASFRAASDQRFVDRHPSDPYVIQYDKPRLTELKRAFPALYRE